MRQRQKVGVVLKLDFEKAYDKVHWGFLIQCMKDRGLNEIWCSWITEMLNNGTVAILQYKGVRQGDPLSPILFNFAVDCLTRMVLVAQQNNLITGLIENMIPRGVAVLQYANDTIMCLEDNVEKARNYPLNMLKSLIAMLGLFL
jgi:hypothetical protein